MSGLGFVAVSVGNSRTAIGRFRANELEGSERIGNDDLPAVVEAIARAWRAIERDAGAAIVLASVNDPVAERLAALVTGEVAPEVLRVGEEIAIPIGTQLDPETITGADRLLNAAAAWERLKGACVIVDAGTAVTVDFVDGVGVFQGGAIAPGARMQLDALHAHTAALPQVGFVEPDDEAFGKNTRQAMLQGVFHGIRGLVWRLTERYAERYGAFPPVIATGGDAASLFARDELVNHIVPDLTLLGIAAAVRAAAADA
ncbi:MAG: type III pantothenate kinase [Phycisphaerales bacterium]